ncbi:MAG: GNAT family N-acetyltransferase [Burkholderiales bacterium]
MAFNVQLRPLSQVDARTDAAWSELALRALERNPFFEPVVVHASAQYMGLDVALLTVESGGDMLLCLPLIKRTLRWARVPFMAWTGWDPISAPLLDAPHPAATLEAAFAHLGRVQGPDFLVLDWVPGDGLVASALTAVTAGRRPAWLIAQSEGSRPVLHRREAGDYTAGTLAGRHRRKQGNRRRNLEKRLGAPLELVDESASADAIGRLLAMEFRGWKGRIGSAVMCRPDFTTYFRETCARFAEEGRMQVLSLQAAGTTLAMKADIRAGDSLFGLRTAYEEAFAEGSPGVELEIQAINAFHASGARYIDSCTNHAKNPLQWLWPDRRPIRRYALSLGGMLGRVASSRLAQATEAFLRRPRMRSVAEVGADGESRQEGCPPPAAARPA